jgi:hypothetical protein
VSRCSGAGERPFFRALPAAGALIGDAILVLKPSPERRRANNKSARWARNKTFRQEKIEKSKKAKSAWPCFSHRKDQATIRDIGR